MSQKQAKDEEAEVLVRELAKGHLQLAGQVSVGTAKTVRKSPKKQ